MAADGQRSRGWSVTLTWHPMFVMFMGPVCATLPSPAPAEACLSVVFDSASALTVLAGKTCAACAAGGDRLQSGFAPHHTLVRMHYASQTSDLVQHLAHVRMGGVQVAHMPVYEQVRAQVVGGSGGALSIAGLSPARNAAGEFTSPWLQVLAGTGAPLSWAMAISAREGAAATALFGEHAAAACERDARFPLTCLPDPPAALATTGCAYYVLPTTGRWWLHDARGGIVPLPVPAPAAFIVDTGSSHTALPAAYMPAVQSILEAEAGTQLCIEVTPGHALTVDADLQVFREVDTQPMVGMVPMPDAATYSRSERVGVLGVAAMRGRRVGFHLGEQTCSWAPLSAP